MILRTVLGFMMLDVTVLKQKKKKMVRKHTKMAQVPAGKRLKMSDS